MTTITDMIGGRGRTDAPQDPPASRPRPLRKGEADALIAAELLEAVRALAATNTQLRAAVAAGGLSNGVLDSTTVVLDADGLWSRDWAVAAGSAAITNHSSSDVHVAAGPSAQTRGRGATRIRAGAAATVYLASSTMTISGAPGASLTVVVFTGLVPPAWGVPGVGGAATQPTATTAVLTSVPDGTTSTVLLAANASRKGAAIYNESAANLFIAFAATASATAYTIKLPAGGYYELPTTACYTGTISGVWDADSTGSARITELS